MKSIKQKTALLALSLLVIPGADMMAQQTDPTLTAAVIAQTVELNNIHKKRRSTQEKIIAAEAAVTVALDRFTPWRTRCLSIFPTPRVPCRISIR